MDNTIKLNEEQEQALKKMLSGKNVFLTGEAGTGKSTILKQFREKSTKESVFLAPTGIAAVNVNGSTIHSFFMLKPGLLTPDNIEELTHKKKKALIRKAKIIIIDEISMVRSDLFCAIDVRLRELAYGNSQNKPFGGKQIILVGDFFQLPPIVKYDTEEKYLYNELGGIYSFQTKLWKTAKFNSISLKTVHRQKNDTLFLSILNNIRHSTFDIDNITLPNSQVPINSLEALNKCCLEQPSLDIEPVYLCTTNREAQTINSVRWAELNGENYTFKAIISGKFNERDYPTNAILHLKTGARVMLLNNKRLPDGELLYVNGDVGIVKEISPQVVVLLDNKKTCTINANQWENHEYELEVDKISGKEVIRQKIVGTFTQLPIKLAYAISIHKSQGLSLERVELRLGSGCFAAGQLYTGLSRCRSLENLRIDRKVYADDIIQDENVVNFYRSLENPLPIKQEVNINIPKEHEKAVLELLAKLEQQNNQSNIITPVQEKKKIYNHIDIDKLIVVYENQTSDEQGLYNAKNKNGIGFNKFDAGLLTPIAQSYLEQGFIYQDELKTVSRAIAKYKGQWEDMI